MKTKTAVEWLYDQLEFDDSISMDDIEKIFDQAKQMEKEQIMDAHLDGQINWEMSGKKYYNETFKSE